MYCNRGYLQEEEEETRMHSSRMRTGRALTVFRSLLLPEGGGLSAPGGGWLVGGVSAPGGCLLQGGVRSVGVSGLGGVVVRHSPPGTRQVPPPM